MANPYVPSVSKNPLRLAWSLLRSGNPAARSALFMAAAGIACWPFDKLLAPAERRRLRHAAAPTGPQFIVCGAPRSGTTLVAQFLINSLDVAYLNNLTSLFPGAPLTVNRIWGRGSLRAGGSYSAFYGKSQGLRGVNDALYLWDRWLGGDRKSVPQALLPGAERELPAFFGELERLYGKPVVNKVNRLNTCASLVAPVLPSAVFLFVERSPLWLAQSLYVARERIGGDLEAAYGTQHPGRIEGDPVADVCAQVRFHREASAGQLARLGPDRALRVSYEAFCADPAALIDELRGRVGADRMPPLRTPEAPPVVNFDVSEKPRLPEDVLRRMAALLEDNGP